MTEKAYYLNLETSKIELHFDKSEYTALPEQQKKELKRYFLFSGSRSAWVSRSTNHHYSAIQTAKKLGFVDGGKIRERLSYAEQLERKAERAEARAERYEQYADNAERRAGAMQADFKENAKDWSWLTQPNINSSRGRAFTRQRQRIVERYERGFDEYRKSEYFKERASIAQGTASREQLQNKTYLNNRIEECNKNIRALQKNIVKAEERNNSEWLESLLEKMEYQIDKLAFFQNCMEELGGVAYSKDNVKAGYLVKIRGRWETVIKANPKTVEAKCHASSLILKNAYAEIQEMKIPEGWTEQKDTLENPFKAGDILVASYSVSNKIRKAFQVIKTTEKNVVIQEIKVENGQPLIDQFVSDKQERRVIKKDRAGNFVANHDDWYLYLYKIAGAAS